MKMEALKMQILFILSDFVVHKQGDFIFFLKRDIIHSISFITNLIHLSFMYYVKKVTLDVITVK